MDETVNVWVDGRVGRIRLNRPKALNALDLPMVAQVEAALAKFASMPEVHAVLVDATGEKAFCAGGDVRAIRAQGMAGDTAPIAAFFEAEYRMNQTIADYAKPYVALVDGICLGGGIGISVHGSHRVASEHAMFAMPETAIALFPDIGATYLLPRMPGALGMYLALTGARVLGADAVHVGLATHYVSRARLPALAEAIAKDGVAVIAAFAEPLPAFTFEPHMGLINTAFAKPSVGEIVAALEADGGEFALETLAILRGHSPSSIHWSFKIVSQGAHRTLPDCLAAELALVKKITGHPEFFEGVRAVVVDKDRAPKWQPARLEEVDHAAIDALFA
ncbi:MAG TPA: enoyl-CoA hydratase/isomerase family protein [Acidocella sp.]|nr:enoyl-CoA hydratase/isomerase family protein [Acidocella sp.]HQU03483.1 enoyl-CoA hydratase/isomerase family protein [Acidocella sp.]